MSLLTVAAVARGRWQIAAGMLSLLLFLPPDRARRVEMHVLDVGQGDGLLLLDGDRSLLIDGGGWREGDFGGRVLRPVLVSLGVRRLDVAVVTHFDTDHCGGLSQVMRSLAIEELWVSASWGTAPCVRELLLDSQARTRILWRGERVEWEAWSFRVLHPPPGRWAAATTGRWSWWRRPLDGALCSRAT
jgi:beta-lactamase superfamily II metal-dependent hydrolase